jgi:hypothetical protein
LTEPYADFNGNLFDRKTGRGYMHQIAHAYRSQGYDIEGRLREVEGEYICWKSEHNLLFRFVATCLFSLMPFLRTSYLRRHQGNIRRCQVLELRHHISVLQTLLELERKERGSGRGGGRKGTRTRSSPHYLPTTAAPTSLSLH